MIYYTLRALEGRPKPVVREAHLLGGAVGARPPGDWKKAAAACENRLHNYWSSNDQVLRLLYRAGTGVLIGSPAVGSQPIDKGGRRVRNHDVSGLVGGHGEYKRNAVAFLR